jgi:Mg-chelatase subunit ChlI
MVRFSDLTNKIIEDDAVVRIVVEQHPALENGPVEIEASLDEVEPIRKGALSLVTVKLYQGDGSEPETVTMEIEEFNNLAGGLDMDMEDVIRRAGPAYPPRKQARSAPASAVDKLDYSALEHAGKPHRGKTTDAEKDTVRDNLAAINERLKSDGIRTIDLDNAEHVTRYGLETLTKEADHSQ